jgi:UDP-glucose 4-epimerase
MDVKSMENLYTEDADIDMVFHYAANPEVRVSTVNPEIHFNENVYATFKVLEFCRKHDIPYLIFASTSTVYGDAEIIPTPEDYHPLNPISVYGASKLASEDLIKSYSNLYGLRSLIIRYANIIGPRSNHGVIIDFINKLRNNPYELEILGDGTQKKSYLHVYDAVDATIHLTNKFIETGKPYEIYNVGSEDWITVNEIADVICEEMNLKDVKYKYIPATEDGRGWPGDVKLMLLDISKLRNTGWSPRWNSKESVKKTVRELLSKQISP